MKTLLSTIAFVFALVSFSQDVDGFTIISQESVTVANSDHFALTSGETGDKTKQMNTFNISFKDSIFIHTPGAYKSKEGPVELISQVYKITNVLKVTDKNGIDLYLVTVKSGLSGKSYDYYIEYNGTEVHITQIYDMLGTKESGYKYNGLLFNKLEYCIIRSFAK